MEELKRAVHPSEISMGTTCSIALSKIINQRFEEVVFSLPLLAFSGFAN